jgi:AP endonuclease-1
VLPHGSYLVNLAHADPEKAEQSYNYFLDDLQRCEVLGIELYNFHPGNTGPHPRAEAIARIAANLNKAHKVTTSVVTVLENMAGAGNTIGSTFEDLRDIIALIEDKSRVGICIDTCHCFAAGYDLRSPAAFQATMATLSAVVGLRYVKALHLNDSKAPLGSRRDLHANIGTGFLGLRAFHNVVNYSPFQNLPMVLETPIERAAGPGEGRTKGGKGVVEDTSIWATEIKLLEGLIGADPDSDTFRADERRLQALGTDDRLKFQGQADKREQRTLDTMFKRKRKEEGDGDRDRDEDGNCDGEDDGD